MKDINIFLKYYIGKENEGIYFRFYIKFLLFFLLIFLKIFEI